MTTDPPGSEAAPDRDADAEALFRAVYHDLIRIVFALLANRADAEDAAQSSFCKLMVAWPHISGLPAAKQRAYLIKIAINEALQILRYPYRRWERLGADAGEQVSAQSHLAENMQAKDELRVVWKAVSELPSTRRDVVALYAAGFEYEEIAASLGIRTSTVRSHISNARKRLSRTAPRDWEGEQQ